MTTCSPAAVPSKYLSNVLHYTPTICLKFYTFIPFFNAYTRGGHKAAHKPHATHDRHWCGSSKILLIMFRFLFKIFYFNNIILSKQAASKRWDAK
jgi:hypothetical protein